MRYRVAIILATTLAACACVVVFAQNRADKKPAKQEQSIRTATESYVAAFNQGDIDAVVAMWAPDAEYVDETGKSTKGREALRALFRKAFDDNKSIALQIKTNAIRFLKDDVAVQDGIAALTMGGQTDNNPFTAIWMKKDGQWQLCLVRDVVTQSPETAEGPNPQLKELGWLVGEWVREDNGVRTTVSGRWAKGQKFLVLEYAVQHAGDELLSLTQYVGWDPTQQCLHSWFFDSRGGFGEGLWSAQPGAWTVEVTGVTADGRHGAGTNKWTLVNNDKFTFQALDRDLDGQPVPDVTISYKRVARAK